MIIRKYLFFLVLFFLPFELNARCIDLIRLNFISSERSTSLLYRYSSTISQLRAKNLLRKLKGINSEDVVITYSEAMIPRDLRDSFSALASDLFNEKVHVKWINDLYNDLLTELHFSENNDYLLTFLLRGKISKDLVIKVLLERSVKGGFSGLKQDIAILRKAIPPEDFYDHLKKGKYILDENFRETAHGDLIHILQLDLMIYIIKLHQINPKRSLDLYKWFGEGLEFMVLESEPHSAWNIFFDMESYFKKMTSPEIISTLYFDFFHIDKNEIPKIVNTQ